MSANRSNKNETDVSTVAMEGPPVVQSKKLRRYKIGYFLSTTGMGPAFAGFITYVSFQLQTTAYLIGREPGMPSGTGCSITATACIVRFGSQDINLTSYILYLNALSFALSGALTMIVSGIGDRMHYQRAQYVLMLVLYGILCLPIAGLKGFTEKNFTTFAVLYVIFNIVGFIAVAWQNVFVPYAMQQTLVDEASSELRPTTPVEPLDNANTLDDRDVYKKEQSGLSMSVWGQNGWNTGQALIYVVVIGLTYGKLENVIGSRCTRLTA